MNSFTFYQDLPPLKLPIASLFQASHFSEVPADWHVILSDVKNSTQAVGAGRHSEVNLVAAGSLIAGLNVAKKHRVEVPFFFGGDGCTLLVPDLLHKEVMATLAAHSRNVAAHFRLQMHMGSSRVSEMLQNGHSIRLAKLCIDAVYNKAIALGSGIRYAEEFIKQDRPGTDTLPSSELDLEGLECRWNKVAPPEAEAENVCYLLEAATPEAQLSVYADVFQTMEKVYGDFQKRHPLCAEKLKPALSWQKLRREMLVKFGGWKPAFLMDAFGRTLFGAFAFRYNWNIGGINGKDYLAELIAHADTLAIDGRVNTIICSTRERHRQFLSYLQQQEEKGALIFGHHYSKESIMTCYIEDRKARHIHFVDGAEGGYTEASKEFKSKLKKLHLVG